MKTKHSNNDGTSGNINGWQKFLKQIAPQPVRSTQPPLPPPQSMPSLSSSSPRPPPPAISLQKLNALPSLHPFNPLNPLKIRSKQHQEELANMSEELTVATLRKLYSSLLEEMAPMHHEIGTGNLISNDVCIKNSSSNREGSKNNNLNAWRWKNQGTILVNGSDDEGYDYAYTPDNSKKSWRLSKGGGNGVGGASGGDWSHDGIRRYYTGGAITRGAATIGGGSSKHILSIGSMDVDVGSIDGVQIDSPDRKSRISGGDENMLDGNLVPDPKSDAALNGENENDLEDFAAEEDMVDVDIAPSSEDVALESPAFAENNSKIGSTNDSIRCKTNNSNSANITAFESLYHLSPILAWRLRSAYAPTTPQEHHLLSLGSELFAQRHPAKADGIIKGLEMTKMCEERVCEGLRRMGELISMCERMKGRRLAVPSSDDDEDGMLEAAEAVFAYFCEKNVLPMLVDSILLSRPPPLVSNVSDSSLALGDDGTINSPQSPFSGVTWTSSVKSQILQTISMIVFNTSSPLSLTYLLSNNYMNELIMGILPLDQWKDEALEDILPPYVTLLRGLVMKLRGEEGSCCVPLFLCQRQKTNNINSDTTESTTTETYMPLLSAAVEVFVSPFGSSLRDSDGSLVRTTAMNAILNLCRITDPEVRSVLVGSDDDEDSPYAKIVKSSFYKQHTPLSPYSPLTTEQEILFLHICKNLNSCYQRSVRLLMASMSLTNKHRKPTHPHHRNNSQSQNIQYEMSPKEEAQARHADVAKSLLSELRYWLGFVDDLLSCSIRTWNVRLCEWLMREVIVGTVLFQWNRSIMTLEMNHKHGVASNSSGLKNPDVYKVAEVRSSMWFITQVFGMVEYTPLIRMVATVVLHEMHPKSWCGPDGDNTGDAVGSGLNFSNNLHAYSGSEGFFVVTPTLNAMVTGKKCSDSRIGEKASSALSNGEEADAGAGGGVPTPSPSSASIPSESSESDDVGQCPKSDKNNSGDVDEMEDHVLEATAAELSVHERKDDDYSSMRDNSSATTTVTVEEEKLISNPYRASLLNMLAGDSALEDTVLASMLFATILENEAIDDDALEALGVFMDEGSPFEKSLAHYLQRDLATIHSSDIYAPSYATLASAVECISSLGLMLLERIVFRRFASSKIEDLHDIDQDPFDQYCKSSEWIRALGGALSYFALYARRLSQSETVSDLFAEFMESAIGQRYSNEPERSQQSVHHIDDEESNINLVCSLHKYFPSNFIDNSNMLINDVMGSNSLGGSTGKSFQNETEASKFAIRLTLHLRSLMVCVQEFHSRFSSLTGPRSKRWYDEEDSISFRTTENADAALLAISGTQTTRLPQVGTDIDIRGRTFFYGTLHTNPNHKKITFHRNAKAAAAPELAIVVDLSEFYVTKLKKGDPNRCTVLCAVPLRTVIASATEGASLHVAIRRQEKPSIFQDEIIKDGKLTLCFESSGISLIVKETLEKYCSAYRFKIATDIDDMLEKCCEMAGNLSPETSESSSTIVEEEWDDFQQA